MQRGQLLGDQKEKGEPSTRDLPGRVQLVKRWLSQMRPSSFLWESTQVQHPPPSTSPHMASKTQQRHFLWILCSLLLGSSFLDITKRVQLGIYDRYCLSISKTMGSFMTVDRNTVLKRVLQNGLELSRYEEFQDDEKIAYYAIRNNSAAFDFISERLKNDTVFLRKLLRDQPGIYKRIPCKCELLKDRSLAISLVKISSLIYECLPPELKGDLDLIKEMIRSNPNMFELLSKELQQNRDLIKTLVRRDARQLCRFDDTIRNDPEIVMLALQSDSFSLRFAGIKACDDEQVVYYAIERRPRNLAFVSGRLQNDRQLLKYALSRDPEVIRMIPHHYRSDKEMMLAVVQRDGRFLQLVSHELQDDYDIAVAALRSSQLAYPFVSHRFRVRPFFQWLKLGRYDRRQYARWRLIKGVLEEARIRRKYHPSNVWFQRMVEKDEDL